MTVKCPMEKTVDIGMKLEASIAESTILMSGE